MKSVQSILTVTLVTCLSVQAKAAEPSPEPRLISIFPIGGRAGDTLEVEIRGLFLDQVQLAWFDCNELRAEITKVEPLQVADQTGGEKAKEAGKPKYRGLLRVQIDGDAALGTHYLRVVSPAGLSNPLRFRVTSETNIREVGSPHDQPHKAQPINFFPAVIHGRLPDVGEVDYYSFQASRGQLLCFQIDFHTSSASLSLFTFRPTLGLYELSGSWFDPDREVRLAVNDPLLHRPTLAFRFAKDGEYFLAVGEISGKPGMDDDPGYQLRAFDGEGSDRACVFQSEQSAHQGPLKWARVGESAQKFVPTISERDFSRRIEGDWIERLWSRSVRKVHNNPSGAVEDNRLATTAATDSRVPFDSFGENEPNDTIDQALDVSSIPAVLEGVIGSPGDVDYFKFKVTAGDLLAFEIETPLKRPSEFNPWIKVVRGDGEEILTNLYKEWGRGGNFVVKSLEAKTLCSFEQGGEYFLEIRDVTSQHGNPDFRYKLLVRRQIPHVGTVQPIKDHIELSPGQASTLDVVLELEERFQGEVLLSVDNLPPGVRAFPAVATEPDGPPSPQFPPLREKKLYRPSSQKVTIALLADLDVFPTLRPWLIDLTAQPMLEGKMGDPFAIATIPLLVVDRKGNREGDRRAESNK